MAAPPPTAATSSTSPPAGAPASQRTVPVFLTPAESNQSGGGPSSTLMGNTTVESFSAPVLSYLKEIYSSLEKDSSSPTTSFHNFLTEMSSPASSAAAALLPDPADLAHPISNYFISTSHNTYLSGNQLYGEASKEAYTNVLLRGCRCLEIDVWNGEENPEGSEAEGGDKTEGKEKGKLSRLANKIKDHARPKSPSATDTHGLHNPLHHTKSTTPSIPLADDQSKAKEDRLPDPWRSSAAPARIEPRVLHGHTLTKEVSFRSVCHAIRENAFTASPLPVIVSLEVHANLSQQEIMVEIMRETWSGLLVDLSEAEENSIKTLPSPQDLQNKILIKVKWTPKPGAESNNPADVVESDEEPGTLTPTTTSPSSKKKAKASKILYELARLGIYTRAYSFKSFGTPESSLPNHVFSLSEAKVKEMHETPTQAAAIFTHNRNYLMRVYPSGLRVNSSNVDPAFLWRQGAQMVALNWQKCDRGMMLNDGMFSGQPGWVLKPQGYRGTLIGGGFPGSSSSSSSSVNRSTVSLSITLLAGQNVPLPLQREHTASSSSSSFSFRPYVKLQLHADQNTQPPGSHIVTANPPTDEEEDAMKRKSHTAKTQDPDFKAEEMCWEGLRGVCQELSFLRLKIQHERIGSDDLAAWACIRLDRLRSGTRLIHLRDAAGIESTGALLMKIKKSSS